MQKETLANGSPRLMRRINAARVLAHIRESGAISRADLARLTGLSKPTITNVVEQLCASGRVRPVPSDAGGQPSGRHPQLYEAYADSRRVLGIDIGGDKLIVALADAEGAVVATRRRETSRISSRSPGRILALVKETAESILSDNGVDRQDLAAVGVGTPGVVSAEGVVTLAPQLRGWEGLDLGAALGEIFDCPLHVEREVTLSLLAEQWFGVAQDLEDAIFIQLGVGVGAGLLLGGQVYRGANGGAGEIGLMPHGAATSDRSGFGPFELATGGAALAREGAAAARRRTGTKLLALAKGRPESVTAAMVFASAAAGDTAAQRIVDRTLDVLAQGIAGLVCVLNPSAVILSGGLSRAGDQLRVPLEGRVAHQVPFPPRFLLSTVGDEGVAYGAVRRVTQTLDSLVRLPALERAL